MLTSDFYIGLMSGTSADAIDAALVDFSENFPKLLATFSLPIPADLQQRIHQLALSGVDEINHAGQLDVQMGELFAKAVLELLKSANVEAKQVTAIGSHGQTIRHRPDLTPAFTWQIGDPHIIATRTGITTTADFRRKDMALGGQGAPLTPAFHAYFYRDSAVERVILNMGGIANITYLPPSSTKLVGFDTGPGNTLLDAWCRRHQQLPFDAAGVWASQGQVMTDLLESLLRDPYFALPYPKSTGKEYFNLTWLTSFIEANFLAVDIQATLVALTVNTIAQAILELTSGAQVLLSGGGAKNKYLCEQLQQALGKKFECSPIDDYGVPASWVEAMAFAWFAKCCMEGEAIDLRAVTGAREPAVLGSVCFA